LNQPSENHPLKRPQKGNLPPPRDAGDAPSVPVKSHYNVDEMMEKLRHSSDGSGRRRRRRSHQPVHVARRRRTLLLAAGLLLFALGVALWLGFRWLSSVRIESETFRQTLSRNLSRRTGAVVNLDRVRDGGGGSLSVGAVSLRPPDGILAETVDIEDASASLTKASWVGREWGITNLLLTSARVQLNPKRPPLPADSTALLPPPPPSVAPTSGFRIGISPDPAVMVLDRGRVASLDLLWNGSGNTAEGLRGLDVSFRQGRDAGYEFSGARGTLTLAGFPEASVTAINARLDGTALDITGARLELPGAATVAITGKADLSPAGRIDLELSSDEMALRSLLLPVWADRVAGMVRASSARWSSSFGDGAARSLEGEFSVRGGVLRSMEWVNRIAAALQRRELSILEFNSMRGRFRWTAAGIEISDFTADRDGSLRLRGTVTFSASGEVDGSLALEVSELLLPPASAGTSAFPPAQDGRSVLEFTIGGTAEALTDSLSLGTADAATPVPERPTPAETPADLMPERPTAPGPRENPARPPVPATPDAVEREFRELIGK
jgi:hypothetical protein